MEKAPSFELDLEEWELLLPDDDGLFGGKKGGGLPREVPFNSKGVVHMDYFNCPSDPSQLLQIASMEKPNKMPLITVPDAAPAGELETDEEPPIKEIGEVIITDVPPPPPPPIPPGLMISMDDDQGADSDATTFDSSEGKESVDMTEEGKQEYSGEVDLELDEKEIDVGEKEEEKYVRSEVKGEEGGCEGFGFGFDIWRWRLTGIGALCSIGIAAATICIFILGGRQRHHKQQNQSQKLHFQIYADDKNLKQVVQHATRLNQVMSGARGVPMARANISFGGYYDGLV